MTCWVKETKNHLESSPLWDRMDYLAGYASWGVKKTEMWLKVG